MASVVQFNVLSDPTTSARGGGIHHRGSTLLVTGSSINDNSVAVGGGPFLSLFAAAGGIDSDGTVTVSNSSVRDNAASAPGAFSLSTAACGGFAPRRSF